jgi:uncharacterized membrane protein YfcA
MRRRVVAMSGGLDGLGVSAVVLVGLVAGFVNTIAGGGSLLTLPVLMLLGLPPNLANGTNRLGALFQTFTAARTYSRAGLRPWGLAAPLLPLLLAGAALGAGAASLLPGELFRRIVGVVFLLLLLASAGDPARLSRKIERSLRRSGVRGGVLLALGFYAGFVQAGVGIWLLIVLPGILPGGLRQANAVKVALIHSMMWMALAIFALQGQVAFLVGAGLALGSVAGGYLGARWAARVDETWLRRALTAAVAALSVKLLF